VAAVAIRGGGCGDKLELELLDQEPEFWLWRCVTGEQQFAAVGCRQTDVDHLVTEQTLAPLTARVSLAVEKFAKSA
jgi:hypothetical protein